MRKINICICGNKDGSSEADQRLYLCYTDSTISLLSKSEIFSLLLSSVLVQVCVLSCSDCWFPHDVAHIITKNMYLS